MSETDNITALQEEIERLNAEIRRLRELEVQGEAVRRATLYMLEDLEAGQKAIENARREWTDAFDAVSDPIFIHDADFIIVRANRAYATQAGMDLRDIIGFPYYKCFPKSDGPMASCRRSIHKDMTVSNEEEIRLEDGKIFLSRAFAIRDSEGNYRHSIHIMQDITERRLVEQALEDNEARLNSILRASTAGIILVNDRIIRFVNDALCQQLGYTREELIGSNTRMMYCDDEEYERVGHVLYPELEKNKVGEIETRFKHKQGALIDVWIKCSVVNVNDYSQGVIFTILDISERKQAEKKLAANEEKFRSMTATAQDTILMMDHMGRISYCNSATEKLFGYTEAEMMGKDLHDLIAPERYRLQARKGFDYFVKTGQGAVIGKTNEMEALRRDGSEFPIELSISSTMIDGKWAAVAFIRDISERKAIENELRRENRARRVISSSNSALVHASDEASLLNNICQLIAREDRYPIVWVILTESELSQRYKLAAHAGIMSEDDFKRLDNTLSGNQQSRSPSAIAIHERERQLISDAQQDTRCEVCRNLAIQYDYHSVLIYPLIHNKNCIGSLTITSLVEGDFSFEEVDLMQELADDLAYGIVSLRSRLARERAEQQQHLMLDKLKTNIQSTVQAMADAVETRDPYTAGHQRHVAQLAAAIAAEMGLSENDIEGIKVAATIHDLGKIYVPAEILSKPGRISKIEFELIKTHSQVGYDILKKIDFPWPVARMVWQHHERIDGSGYPQGLKGDEIELGAKILGVADVTEAIASHRPYRPSLGIDYALETVEKDSGILFDAEVVDACLRLFREKGFTIDFI
ncbi:MAG TPA: PAS domain S-box protein [Gammaproteobacteria bacterium]